MALDKLPEISPLDPLGELIELTTGFCEKLSATVYGNMGLSYRPDLIGDQTKSGKAFVQSNRENYRNFKNRIKETAPNFQTSSSLVLYAPDFNVGERRRTNDFDLPYVQNVIKKYLNSTYFPPFATNLIPLGLLLGNYQIMSHLKQSLCSLMRLSKIGMNLLKNASIIL